MYVCVLASLACVVSASLGISVSVSQEEDFTIEVAKTLVGASYYSCYFEIPNSTKTNVTSARYKEATDAARKVNMSVGHYWTANNTILPCNSVSAFLPEVQYAWNETDFVVLLNNGTNAYEDLDASYWILNATKALGITNRERVKLYLNLPQTLNKHDWSNTINTGCDFIIRSDDSSIHYPIPEIISRSKGYHLPSDWTKTNRDQPSFPVTVWKNDTWPFWVWQLPTNDTTTRILHALYMRDRYPPIRYLNLSRFIIGVKESVQSVGYREPGAVGDAINGDLCKSIQIYALLFSTYKPEQIDGHLSEKVWVGFADGLEDGLNPTIPALITVLVTSAVTSLIVIVLKSMLIPSWIFNHILIIYAAMSMVSSIVLLVVNLLFISAFYITLVVTDAILSLPPLVFLLLKKNCSRARIAALCISCALSIGAMCGNIYFSVGEVPDDLPLHITLMTIACLTLTCAVALLRTAEILLTRGRLEVLGYPVATAASYAVAATLSPIFIDHSVIAPFAFFRTERINAGLDDYTFLVIVRGLVYILPVIYFTLNRFYGWKERSATYEPLHDTQDELGARVQKAIANKDLKFARVIEKLLSKPRKVALLTDVEIYPLLEKYFGMVRDTIEIKSLRKNSFRLFNDKVLGSGSFGVVFLGEYKKKPIAAKRLKSLSVSETAFQNECIIAMTARHPNVVRTYGVIYEDSNSFPLIIMELLEFTLERHCARQTKPFSTSALDGMLGDIALGMNYLHTAGVAHRDMNMGNFFVAKDGRVKVGDFGLGRAMTSSAESLTAGAGSEKFRAPEVAGNLYDKNCDIWSFGIVLIELWMHDRDLIVGEYDPIVTEEEWPNWINYDQKQMIVMKMKEASLLPNPYKGLARECLRLMPSQRPPFYEIVRQISQWSSSGGSRSSRSQGSSRRLTIASDFN